MALWLPVIGLQRNLLSMLNCAVPLGLLVRRFFFAVQCTADGPPAYVDRYLVRPKHKLERAGLSKFWRRFIDHARGLRFYILFIGSTSLSRESRVIATVLSRQACSPQLVLHVQLALPSSVESGSDPHPHPQSMGHDGRLLPPQAERVLRRHARVEHGETRSGRASFRAKRCCSTGMSADALFRCSGSSRGSLCRWSSLLAVSSAPSRCSARLNTACTSARPLHSPSIPN